MYTIGICDDAVNFCSELEKQIEIATKEKNIKAEILVWFSGEGLIEYLGHNNILDILFLDIELFKTSGIEVAEFVRNQLQNRDMQIIFISGRSSYAQKLFKTQPTDFLIKPIFQEQVNEVLNTSLKIIEKKRTRFYFQCGKDYYTIPYNEIKYFYSEGRRIHIVLSKQEKIYYGKLKDIINYLSDDFICIHHSYIVNRYFVYKYTYETVELVDGTVLSISKRYRKQVREFILKKDLKC